MLLTRSHEKRLLYPERVHQAWFGIISEIFKSSESNELYPGVTKQSLHQFLSEQNQNGNESSNGSGYPIEKTIEEAIKEGLLRIIRPAENGEVVVSNGTEVANEDHLLITLPHEQVSKGSHDWYCFDCQQPGSGSSGSLIECQHCWRVYHPDCVQKSYDFSHGILEYGDKPCKNYSFSARNFTCPICALSHRFEVHSVGSRHFVATQFNDLLSYAFLRFTAKSSQISQSLLKLKKNYSTFTNLVSFIESNKTSTAAPANGNSLNFKDIITELALRHLSFKPIDLEDIDTNLRNSKYESIGEFLGDCLAFKHMIEVCVVSGIEQNTYNRRRIRDTLVRMLEVIRYELKEMLVCVDCYFNSNQQGNDKLWFCRPCDPPHLALYARQKGFPFWPAKVIYPRTQVEIDLCDQLDVRFFGANHERSMVDKDNIRDINTSLEELSITKTMPSLDKALNELRCYQELHETSDSSQESTANNGCNSSLSKNRKAEFTKKSSRKSVDGDGDKCNSPLPEETNTRARGTKHRLSDDSDRTEVDEDESQDDEDKIQENGEDDATDIDEGTLNDQQVEETKDNILKRPVDGTNVKFELKKRRGRPPKKVKPMNEENESKDSDTGGRIRRQKVIYSPQSSKFSRQSSHQETPSVPVSSRSRKVKPKVTLSTRSPSPLTTSRNLEQRPKRIRATFSPEPKQPLPKIIAKEKSSINNRCAIHSQNHLKSRHNRASNAHKISPKVKSPIKKKKERELKLEKKKREEKAEPKHIPPMVAIKSSPVFAPKPTLPPQPSPLVKFQSSQCAVHTPTAKSFPDGQTNMVAPVATPPQPINGYGYQYQLVTVKEDGTIVKVEPEHEVTLNENLVPYHSTLAFVPPSSILKPLNSEGESDDCEEKNGVQNDEFSTDPSSGNAQHLTSVTTLDARAEMSIVKRLEDEDEDELYDDEQLEEVINLYESQQQATVQQQQQFMATSVTVNPQATLSISKPAPLFNHSFPPPKTASPDLEPVNDFLSNEPVKNYVEFSTDSIYIPTKRNRQLVNNYLHHINVNNDKLPGFKNDRLAQLVLRKDEFEAEPEPVKGPRKRGRPPKNERDLEQIKVARSVLEKNYLQETACNRECLTKNIKTFKKFRDFVESQHQTDFHKVKREVEELKQQVYKLKNANSELEKIVEKERELNRQCNPFLLSQMEAKHRKEISEIKRKIWCAVCESQASFYCCPNASYCSHQCQHKHWQTGHLNYCARARAIKTSQNGKVKKSVMTTPSTICNNTPTASTSPLQDTVSHS